MLSRLLSCANFLLHFRERVNEESYYPKSPHKMKVQIFFDILIHTIKYGEGLKYYFAYGLDVKGKRPSDYLAYTSFRNKRDELNDCKPYSYICLLRDKQLFGIIAKEYRIKVSADLASFYDGKIDDWGGHFNTYSSLFFKPSDLSCGIGSFKLDCFDNKYYMNGVETPEKDIDYFIHSLKGRFIIQPYINQHKEVNEIYSGSINTVRVWSVNPKHSSNINDIVIVGALLRIGARESIVDNWAQGGLVVGIDENGTLMKYGYYKPGHGTKTERHPDTSIKFEGIKLPYYKELIKAVKLFHSKLNAIHSVGWDVAITEDGPLFVEGNDDYELGFFQTCFGGMKKQVKPLFR